MYEEISISFYWVVKSPKRVLNSEQFLMVVNYNIEES